MHFDIQKNLPTSKHWRADQPIDQFRWLCPKKWSWKTSHGECSKTCTFGLHFWYILKFHWSFANSKMTHLPHDWSWTATISIKLFMQLLRHTEDMTNLQPTLKATWEVTVLFFETQCYNVLRKTVEHNNFESGDKWWLSGQGAIQHVPGKGLKR